MQENLHIKCIMLEQNNAFLRNKCEEYLGKIMRYKEALERIAKDRKITSIGCGTEDNSVYVETAREALGWETDIPEYDNPEY